jgi:hypothetical protein
MTNNGQEIDRKKLRSLYVGDKNAKAVLDYFSARERNRSITTVDRLLHKLIADGDDMSRGDVVGVLQRLDEVGCGRFIPGRKGHPSRFEWAVNLVDVGRAAAGESIETFEAASDSDPDDGQDVLLEHHFRLRKDLEVPFRLPADFTAAEAARLAAFIQTIPFDVKQP